MSLGAHPTSETLPRGPRALLPWRDVASAFPRAGQAPQRAATGSSAYLAHLMREYFPLPTPRTAAPAGPGRGAASTAGGRLQLPPLPLHLEADAHGRAAELGLPPLPEAGAFAGAFARDALPELPPGLARHAPGPAPLPPSPPLVAQAELLARKALSLYGPAEFAHLLRQAASIAEYNYLRALRHGRT